MTERPLFIDPITTGDGDEVADNPAPRWFLVASALILLAAVYYLASFLNGPRETSPHTFDSGREAYERVQTEPSAKPSEAAASATPSASAAPSASASAAPSGSASPSASATP